MATTTFSADAAAALRPGMTSRLFALMPLWVLVIVLTGSPMTWQTVGAARPDVYGVPWGLAVEAAAMLWMIVGVIAVWSAGSRLVESLALLVFTIPATVVVVFTPAVILALQNP